MTEESGVRSLQLGGRFSLYKESLEKAAKHNRLPSEAMASLGRREEADTALQLGPKTCTSWQHGHWFYNIPFSTEPSGACYFKILFLTMGSLKGPWEQNFKIESVKHSSWLFPDHDELSSKMSKQEK